MSKLKDKAQGSTDLEGLLAVLKDVHGEMVQIIVNTCIVRFQEHFDRLQTIIKTTLELDCVYTEAMVHEILTSSFKLMEQEVKAMLRSKIDAELNISVEFENFGEVKVN